ncbi:MAG TPA: TerC family protein [Marmoricola sp.]|nr:TerC family protein [Marmoricola sp.]
MHVSPLAWWITIGVTVVIFIIDIFVIGRRPHVPSRREVTVALIGYIGLAIAFGVGIYYLYGIQYSAEFFAGWLTEYSLSVDNLFIFLIIMGKFAVPKQYQQTALLIGIVLALIMRAIFIVAGAHAIENFSWVFYLFGIFLIYTAIKLSRESSDDDGEEYEESRFIKWVEHRFPATSEWNGTSMFIRDKGKLLITPMFIVILALGTTDLLFALDSIPAIFGLTKEPYLVFTANVFALMGLRQLYFLIGGLLERLIYLSYGLAFLLFFIGVKLVLHAMHENELPFINGGKSIAWAPEIPIWVSLLVIVLTLGVTAGLSLIGSREQEQTKS